MCNCHFGFGRTCEGSDSSPHKNIVGAKCSSYLKKIILPYEMRVEYGYPSSVRDYLSEHILHRIQCNNVTMSVSIIYI